MMEITVNGAPTMVATGSTVEDLVEQMITSTKGVAVALDREVIPRSRWSATELRAGQQVEIVTAAAGG